MRPFKLAKSHSRMLAVLFGVITLGLAGLCLKPSTTRPGSVQTVTRAHFAQLPLSFEPNRGQADSAVKFLARGNGYRLSLTADGATLALHSGGAKLEHSSADVLRMKLVNANSTPHIEPLNELPGKSNYLIGSDQKQWRTDIANYTSVKYHEVYPGVDLLYYGQQSQLEYDFILQPGANPQQIKLAFAGAEQMRIEDNGDLLLGTAVGEVRQHKPVVYQEVEGVKRFIAGRYVRTGEHEVGFEVGEYDANKPLVIDPVLSYSSYLGGSGSEFGSVIAADASGNIYVAGFTNSANFVTANALQPNYGGGGDCFVTKLNPSGTAIIYSTYLGGSGNNVCLGLALDSANNVYLTGLTSSTNFPTVGALQQSYGGGSQDGFAAKLNANGSALAYATYLGGSGGDLGQSIVVDANGAAYVIGGTSSTNFPTKNALQPTPSGISDVFVAKIQPGGAALVYSTFLGGNGGENGGGIAVDAAGNLYVSGATSSTNFPTTPNAFQPALAGAPPNTDIFVAKLNPSGTGFVYSTYLGGNGGDAQLNDGALAIDAAGNAYVTGFTNSPNFPTANPLQANYGGAGDAFVTKLNANGTALIYSTYLGGNGTENITADNLVAGDITVDAAGQAYVVGTTNSTNFPTANAVQATFGGVVDAFVTKLNASGSAFVYSTYFGGSNSDDGFSIVVDSIGNAYFPGRTLSTNLPTVNALQSTYGGGGSDAFIVKLGADAVTVSAASFSGAAIASKAIVAAFGPNLATATASASSVPLPTTLAGTTVRIRDSAGTERAAPLFFVSANQINYQIPDGTAAGPAAVTVTSSDGRVSSAVMRVVSAAPSIFSLNASGTGAAAAVDALTGAPAPFNAKRGNGEPNIIAVFGTGLGADATDVDGDVSANMQATIDGNPVTVLYAGRAPGLIGLNQFNIVLSNNVAPGTHSLTLARGGAPSNTVTLAIK